MARRPFAKREHPGVFTRRNRAYLLALMPEEKRAQYKADFREENLPALPKLRGPRADHAGLEKHVLSAVGEYLALHPKVYLAVRQNSGSLPYDRNGRPVPVQFYRIIKQPVEITITDFWGFFDARPFALECKRPSWTGPTTDREKRQQAFLHLIECVGGISGFVRSVDEVRALLP
jgi:hypothetical protein